MKVLVTGSKGFLGAHIVRKLEELGFETAGFDLPECDLSNRDQLHKAISECTDVVHCAAVADVYHALADYEKCTLINVVGTERVATICKALGKNLYFISTMCAYGNGGETLAPTENYAAGKIAAEYLIRGTGCRHIIFRCPTMFGPGMREALFVFQAMRCISAGNMITVNGDGNQERQYGYVEDTAANIALAVSKQRGWNDVYDLPGPQGISVNRVISEVENLAGRSAFTRFVNARPWEIHKQVQTFKKFQDAFGAYHVRPFSDGMALTWEWFKS